jgi:hypothetical protein
MDDQKSKFILPWSDLIITLAIIRSWFYPSEVVALTTLLTKTAKIVAKSLGIAAAEVAKITLSAVDTLRKVFICFFCVECFLFALFVLAICSDNGFANLIMLMMGVGVVSWLFTASWIIGPFGDRGRAFKTMIQGLAYIPLILFYIAVILTVLPHSFLTLNTVVFSCAFALLLATLTLLGTYGGKLLRGFMYTLLIVCMLVGFSVRSPFMGDWVTARYESAKGFFKIDTAKQKGESSQKSIQANFLKQLQPRILICSQPLFDATGDLVTPKKVLGKGTPVFVDMNKGMKIGAFANAGVQIFDPKTYKYLGVVPIRALSARDEKAGVARRTGGGISQRGIFYVVLVTLAIIFLILAFTSKLSWGYLALALIALVVIGCVFAPKPELKPRLTLQEEKGCEQLIVMGETFKVGDFIVPNKVDGGSAYWADGRLVKVGTGRPVLNPPPLRFCATDPNMNITYYVM